MRRDTGLVEAVKHVHIRLRKWIRLVYVTRSDNDRVRTSAMIVNARFALDLTRCVALGWEWQLFEKMVMTRSTRAFLQLYFLHKILLLIWVTNYNTILSKPSCRARMPVYGTPFTLVVGKNSIFELMNSRLPVRCRTHRDTVAWFLI